MKQRQSAQAGFSMIEMLIAVVILAVGLLGLAELQITATKANAHSEAILAASAIAQQVIEEVASMDSGDAMFDYVTGHEADDDYLAVDDAAWDPSSVTLAGAGTYNIKYDVITRFNGITDLCQVVVRVASAQEVMTVFGVQQRSVTATIIKRAT